MAGKLRLVVVIREGKTFDDSLEFEAEAAFRV
jgi:hypothetical protein